MRNILIVILSVLSLAACDPKPDAKVDANADGTRHLTIVSRDGKNHDFDVELALTPRAQKMGLMNRTSMPENAGMLFLFGEESERAFWMKNTLIPLDMIFIRKDGTIGHIHDSAKPNDLTSVPSQGPALAVLELNGGTAKKLGIADGDKVRHVFFGNAP